MTKYKATLKVVLTLYLICFTIVFSTDGDSEEQTTTAVYRSSTKNSTIFNQVSGKNAKPTDFPFVVFLYRRIVDTNRIPICGGTIVSEKWVLTSATCLIGRIVAGQVIAGSSNRNKYKMKNVRRVIRTIVHPNFEVTTNNYNIGMVKVGSKFIWSDSVQPVKLAKQGTVLTSKIPANVIMWGQNRGGQVSTVLAIETVSILTGTTCSNISEVICSVNERNGPCPEDSGYPLLIGKGLQVGIVSHDLERCTENNTITKYTNVANFRKWIRQVAHIKEKKN